MFEAACAAWTDWERVTRCSRVDLSTLTDEDVQADLIAQATDLLYMLSGRRYPGLCETTRQVCLRCSGWCRGTCGCRYERFNLRGSYPVHSVEAVTIEGEVLDAENYELHNRRWLVRTDDTAWPRGTPFQVEYTQGRAPSEAAIAAAAALTADLAAGCVGQACSVPHNVRSVNSEGVNITVVDVSAVVEKGLTNVTAADLWLIAERQGRKVPPGATDPSAHAHLVAVDQGPGVS